MIARWPLTLFAAAVLFGSAGCRAIRTHDCCDDGCNRGRQFAGMKYEACCEQCGGGFACGDACSGGCDGCVDNCCDACSCGDCGRCAGDGCGCNCQHGLFGKLCHNLCGCAGCGEFYWCEWRNDPPACCEPCDCHGNYIGPGEAGYYRAPYREPDLAK